MKIKETLFYKNQVMVFLTELSIVIFVCPQKSIIYHLGIDYERFNQICSTVCQIIGTMLGLIITGYIFLVDSLNKQKENDQSKKEIIVNLQKRYYLEIVYLILHGLVSMSLCFLVMTNLSSIQFDNLLITVVVFQLIYSSFVSIVLVNPNKIIDEANRIVNKINYKKQKIKDTEEYLDALRRIDRWLIRYAKMYVKENVIYEGEKGIIKIVGTEGIISRMVTNSIITVDQANDLVRLIKIGHVFKNSLIKQLDKNIIEKTIDLSKKLRESIGCLRTEEN